MKVKNLFRTAVVSALMLAATFSARAWDGTGHMLVGQIAYDRLNDKAKARVSELAAKIQKDGVPYNAVNICCWADDIKGRDADTPFRGHFRDVALHRYRVCHERPGRVVESIPR